VLTTCSLSITLHCTCVWWHVV